VSVLYCVRCEAPFRIRQGEEWKTLCLGCWKVQRANRAPVAPSKGDQFYSEAKEYLPALIQLCHPDKHHGSSLSNKVTQWLLEVKRRT
jgi:hypothetical protein